MERLPERNSIVARVTIPSGIAVSVLLLALVDLAWGAGWTAPFRVRSVESLNLAQVAMNAAGHAVVVWEEEQPDIVIQAALRAPGGAFTPAPPPSQPGAGGARVRIDAAGNVTVGWIRNGVVQTAVRPAGGAFAGAQDILGGGTSPSDLELAVDASGRALAIWRSSAALEASTRPANGAFGPASAFEQGVPGLDRDESLPRAMRAATWWP